jgi:type I restriction enzyme S subunit
MGVPMNYKPYPKYKAVGWASAHASWLEEIPEGWEVKAIKRDFKIFNGATPKSANVEYWSGQILWITPSDLSKLRTKYIDDSIRKITKLGLNSCGTVLVPKGSIVLSTRAPIGNVAISDKNMCTNQGCKSAVPRKVQDTRFLYYNLLVSSSQLNNLGKGATFMELSNEDFGSFKIPFPPLKEQTQIANYLDQKTKKIDTLIEKQQSLIELLKEKRQALISHVVTKGLDNTVLMKESGVAWLGEVPEGWEVTRLGYISKKIGSGKTPRGGSEIYTDIGILFLRSQNVYDEGLFLEDVVRISEKINNEMENTKVKSGDILLNVTGASIGRTVLVPDNFEQANVNQHVCIIRLNSKKYRKYISIVMKSLVIKNQIDAIQNGAAREGLNFEQIANFKISLPPLKEQTQIANYLDQKTKQIDTLIEKAKHSITLLKERRTALISAVVTGKVDVRGL